jgi:hypothetical protein
MPIEFLSIKIFNIVKVLFISRATLFLLKDKGGDTIQVINTAKYLKALGADVDILLCNDEIDYSSIDPIHFFNIIRPADILYHIKNQTNLLWYQQFMWITMNMKRK